MTLQEKLKKIVLSELPALTKDIILEDNNRYLVFKHYTIDKDGAYFSVNYKGDYAGTFSSIKTALSWCIAEKVKRINLARRILELDGHKIMLDTDINISKSILQKSKSVEFKEITRLKLITKLERRDMLKNELSKCTDQAKYIEITRINNETGRIINT